MPAPICYGQYRGRGWQQEWYETASRGARIRAAQLRRAGYQVVVSGMGSQVTPVGRVNMTLLSIAPGRSGDPDLLDVPEVTVQRLNPWIGFEPLARRLARRPGVYSPRGLTAWIGRRKYGAETFAEMARAGRRNPRIVVPKLRVANPRPGRWMKVKAVMIHPSGAVIARTR